MIVSTNHTNKNESKYECDRCKTKITIENKYAIYVKRKTENPKKKCDLCERCYKAFLRGVFKPKRGGVKAKDG